MPYLRSLAVQLKDWVPAADHSDLVSFDHHFMLYNRRPDLAAEALAFYDAAGEEPLSALADRSTGGLKGDVERCVDLIAQAGHEVIAVDLTTPDLAEAGFSVVRILVPGLIPLHSVHDLPYLGIARLRELPWRSG